MMDQAQGEKSDSNSECEYATLQAHRRGGPCYYCAKEGHFLRNCPLKAAGLPRSAPFVDDKGGRRDDRRWKERPDPLPARREWNRGCQKEEYRPLQPLQGAPGNRGERDPRGCAGEEPPRH